MEKAFTTQFKTLSCSHFTNSDTDQKNMRPFAIRTCSFRIALYPDVLLGVFLRKKMRHFTFPPKTAFNAQNDQKQSFKLFFEFFTQKMTKTEIKTTNN